MNIWHIQKIVGEILAWPTSVAGDGAPLPTADSTNNKEKFTELFPSILQNSYTKEVFFFRIL